MIGYLEIALATAVSTARVLALIGASIVTGWLLGYIAIKSKVFENVYTSLIGVFESVPVFSFFPVVLVFFVSGIGGYLGAELAADFLVFTAVVWNIWIGIYQAFKTVPREMVEVAENVRLGFLSRMRHLYIPYSMPRIAANLMPSFSDGFFYITVSEVFSVGSSQYSVFGIGSVIAELTAEGNWGNPAFVHRYLFALGMLALAVGSVIYGFRELANYVAGKYAIDSSMPVRRIRLIPPWLARGVGGPLARIARITAAVQRRATREPVWYEEEKGHEHLFKVIGAAVGLAMLGVVIYGAISVITSTPASLWRGLLDQTGQILLALALDYGRVFAITLLSMALAVTLGYYLATHHEVERVVVPAIQVFAAYPAPVYFPLIFAATYPVIYGVLGYYGNELYAILLGFISTFYYVFYSFWMGLKAMPHEIWELMDNLNLSYWGRLRLILLPAAMPYLVAGISSTIDSAWGGLAIGEYWPGIYDGHDLAVGNGLMKLIVISTAEGNIALAAWASLIFGVVVVLFAIFFTRRLMDLAQKKYVVEEAIYAA
ncbi:binding-protein-dependent transport systems inner membrane component [Thermoproteus uzoniensis 768-20]|uniref:Binding-protein-dependent transport systems inner membrane component n=1 Tax=Thermoproteus uzoniensis (strain 768-20) TaxID=999630 RepID=F2L241_THEU7|nr:ABC transporter permease subunit [Thermoproteus uzoniensis]AEA12968.1 binding-protein-dependent transport systems inner membrane component [Thermoproteus uzoniensis 768-20]